MIPYPKLRIKSVVVGRQWESILERKANREGVLYIRIPDGCRQLGLKKIVRVRSPLDYVLVKDGRTVFVDAKTVDSEVMSYSFLHNSKSTTHQLELMRRVSLEKVRAGLLVWFREPNVVSYFDAQLLSVMTPKHSIKYDAGLILGRWEDFKLAPLFQLDFEAKMHDPLVDGRLL